MKALRITINVLLFIASVAYPFIVYFSIEDNQSLLIPIVLMTILLVKLVMGGREYLRMNFMLFFFGLVMSIMYVVRQEEVYMLLYPTIVNLALLVLFGQSLVGERKPIVEYMASFTTPKEKQTDFFKKYCRRVTMTWCIFFIINGSFAFYTAEFCSREVWTMYNGFIAYLLIGLLFVIEYVIRIACQRRELSNDNKKL